MNALNDGMTLHQHNMTVRAENLQRLTKPSLPMQGQESNAFKLNSSTVGYGMKSGYCEYQ